MAKKKRLDHHDDEHIDETWLIPYADLLTLLLALFIVLFSMRSEDSVKANALMESLYKAFNTISVFETDSGGQTPNNNNFTDNVTLPKPIPDQKPEDEISEEEKKLQALMVSLQQYIDQKQLNAVISLTDLQEGIQITLKDTIIFDSGSDVLKSNFVPTLNDIAGMIQTVDNSIIIEGHTDNKPINSSEFPSNWELSAARSLSVLHYFQSIHIDPKRLRVAGYGEFKPIFPNDTPEHREANRRVNIIVLRK
jgi:chemotaxis protein MotB